MALERGRYYYRVKRIGGKVRREYAGTGLAAVAAALADAAERSRRYRERQEEAARRAEAETLDEQVARLCEWADVVARAALIVAGCRQHARGQWRRKR